jgi:hypothetical protein
MFTRRPPSASPLIATLLVSSALIGCHASPPPRWAEGGAKLIIPTARWHTDDATIEIRPNGDVLEDGKVVFMVDRVGRVVDDDHEPVALLLANGTLAGTDNQDLGHIGVANAAPPFRAYAWLSLRPDGTVVRFDAEGERTVDGVWEGCGPAAVRTCTLVTHLFALRSYSRGPTTSVGIGVGYAF